RYELEERARRHLGIARRALGQVADVTLRLRALRLDVETADECAAGRGRQEARDDTHRGALPGAVGTQEAEHFARLHPKTQAIYGAEPTVVLGKALAIDHLDFCGKLFSERGRARRTI